MKGSSGGLVSVALEGQHCGLSNQSGAEQPGPCYVALYC